MATATPSPGIPNRVVLDGAFAQYSAAFDHDHGGFGRAAKFPMPAALDFLLRYHRRTRNAGALEMVEQTLAAMAAGGVRDQLGGGFHRYAVDAAWAVPHFEKMLYDNAQLAALYLDAWQVTGRAEWREVATEILDDVERSLRAPEGAFCSAINADDPLGEGVYYTWTRGEIDALLDDGTSLAFRSRFGVGSSEDLDGRSVLRVARAWAEVACDLGVDETRARALVAAGRAHVLSARERRPPPAVDAKILAGWNGLAIGAFARAGAALGMPHYIAVAREAAAFVVDHMVTDEGVMRVYAGGGADQAGFLEDHTFVIGGLLDLFEATSDLRWLHAAERLQAAVDRDFWDEEAGGYFESGRTRDDRLPRSKPLEEEAIPSGNALAVDGLLRLASFRDDENSHRRAEDCLRTFGGTLAANPTAAPRMLGALETALDRMWEVVVVSPAGRGDEGRALLSAALGGYLPNRVIVATTEGRELLELRRALPFVADKTAIADAATAYVCERGRCLQPTADPETLRRQLASVLPSPAAAGGRD